MYDNGRKSRDQFHTFFNFAPFPFYLSYRNHRIWLGGASLLNSICIWLFTTTHCRICSVVLESFYLFLIILIISLDYICLDYDLLYLTPILINKTLILKILKNLQKKLNKSYLDTYKMFVCLVTDKIKIKVSRKRKHFKYR